MLTIRHKQMIAIQEASFKQRYDMAKIITIIIGRLRQMNVLGTPSKESEGTPEGEGEYSEAEKLLRRQVMEELDQALLYGFKTMSGLTQFVGYRFMLSPDWHKKSAIKAILAKPHLEEQEKFKRIHTLVSSF